MKNYPGNFEYVKNSIKLTLGYFALITSSAAKLIARKVTIKFVIRNELRSTC